MPSPFLLRDAHHAMHDIFFCVSLLSANDINRYIQYFCNFQNRINMSSHCCCHMMSRTCLAPSVAKFSCTDGKSGSHIGITESKDRSVLVYAFCHNKFEMSVFILCDSELSHISCRRIELGQITAACFSMKDINNLHRRFACL